jgi:hypothetical protein
MSLGELFASIRERRRRSAQQPYEKRAQIRKVCQFFCVNGQILFFGDGVPGKGQFPFPGPAL